MYEEYFGLSAAPFKLNPDPKFFFGSKSHNKAMAYLHYGLRQSEGFIVVTGEIGAGKSIMIGHLLDQLNRSNVVAAHLLTTNIAPTDLLTHILSAFRIEAEGEGRAAELEAFEDFLFDQLNRGRRVLLIVDEAQNLPPRTIEELRMLSNIDYDGTPLFQVFLVGQPEFRDMLAADNMEQLRQRVIASYHLEPLDAEEMKEYINHRLTVAGWRDDPAISDEAFSLIFEETDGVPRRVNTLMSRLLLSCALEKTHQIDGDVFKSVADEMHGEKFAPTIPRSETVSEIKVAFKDKDTMPAPSQTEPAPEVEVQKIAETPLVVARTQRVATTGESVFDRLRSKRNDEKSPAVESKVEPVEPEEATLDDVATAIAAIASDSPAPGPATPVSDGTSEADEPPLIPEAERKAILDSVITEDPKSWRRSMSRSLNDARSDLKMAHASVARLRRKISDIESRRADSRLKIDTSLSRAQTLLDELREGPR